MKILLTQPGKLNTVPMGRFASKALVNLGHEVVEFDVTPAWQEKLLGSQGRYSAMNYRLRRLIERDRPDLMLAVFGFDISTDTLNFLKQRNIPRACWWLNDPFQFSRSLAQARDYDFIFSNSLGSVADYQREGISHAHWLPAACAPDVHRRVTPVPAYRCDVCFAGDWSPLREEWCEILARHFDLRIFGPWKKKLAPSSRLHSCLVDGFFTPEQMVGMFSSAKVVFNLHSWYGKWDHGTNPRLFEAAGCGACQVVDWKIDIPRLFDNNSEIATYRNEGELIGKIRELLCSDELRSDMGEHVQRRAYTEHTYPVRMKSMLIKMGV
jgi:spore maturation protein CgeB